MKFALEPKMIEVAAALLTGQCHGQAKHNGWWTELGTGMDLTSKGYPKVLPVRNFLRTYMTTDIKCCACQKVFPVEMFGKDRSRKNGLTARCKPCNRKHHKGLDGYVKPEPDTNKVPPRSMPMSGFYVQVNDTYYRNDGLKHIKSRGF